MRGTSIKFGFSSIRNATSKPHGPISSDFSSFIVPMKNTRHHPSLISSVGFSITNYSAMTFVSSASLRTMPTCASSLNNRRSREHRQLTKKSNGFSPQQAGNVSSSTATSPTSILKNRLSFPIHIAATSFSWLMVCSPPSTSAFNPSPVHSLIRS